MGQVSTKAKFVLNRLQKVIIGDWSWSAVEKLKELADRNKLTLEWRPGH